MIGACSSPGSLVSPFNEIVTIELEFGDCPEASNPERNAMRKEQMEIRVSKKLRNIGEKIAVIGEIHVMAPDGAKYESQLLFQLLARYCDMTGVDLPALLHVKIREIFTYV
ncbi:hypothetical protein KQX54_002173 [Cotesia glomerata]|uniref:Uncharacterized protein n=1 Tax=Cotesia glomerata TaxID=32391 RepID=A0AAV7IL71_COTGL|nr:hypothetical protein KQX54_002173 [Cotesia glomerata]